eukprot:scaffold1202_cov384-Prasinococcus_capsulatus_cf.AAC.1
MRYLVVQRLHQRGIPRFRRRDDGGFITLDEEVLFTCAAVHPCPRQATAGRRHLVGGAALNTLLWGGGGAAGYRGSAALLHGRLDGNRGSQLPL